LVTLSAQAAQVNPAELPPMAAQAQKHGATPVVVHLAGINIDQLRTDLKGVNATMAQRSARLLAELGQQAWDAGRWDNGLGQIGIHVTPAGLQMLQNSGNAISFRADQSWSARSKLNGFDGSHAEIDRLLDANGYVDAAVTLNVDGLEFDTLKDGSVSLRTSAKTGEEARAKAKTLLDSLSAAQAPGKNAATAAVPSMATPAFTVRLTREGVVKLAASDLVRSLKPAGFVDARAVNFDDDILPTAQKEGSAQVIVGIRTPMMGGNPSPASFAAQTQSHKRALDGLLADTGVRSRLQDLTTMGAMAGTLTLAELQALKASKDARLFSVELNRPMGTPSLATSTTTMNMPAAWSNPNWRGAGQNIIVLDTGIQSDHEFFKDANGASRVFFQGCYGTNRLDGGVFWESICPQQDLATGDSPAWVAGSAAHRLNCRDPVLGTCDHGTQVAGIAAGHTRPLLPAGLQGVAPDARIAAFQVFSYDKARVVTPRAFKIDLYIVLQSLISIMTPGTVNNPFVINMSLGGGRYVSDCYYESPLIAPLVLTLFNLGVPIVAATGNNGYTDAISWPACLSKVIKVSAVNNDTYGNTRPSYANMPDLSFFPDEAVWLAPGGGSFTDVITAAASTTSVTDTFGYQGTSLAAPHIAGFYAALKAALPGMGIHEISQGIYNNASVNVTFNLCITATSCRIATYKRPRWP
jgi:Subtilase family